MQKTFYRCDPEKNTECKKRNCALAKKRGKLTGECEATDNPDFAQLNEAGKPIVAFVVMRGEDNGAD